MMKGQLSRSKRALKKKAIAREFELKRRELGIGAPNMKRGIGFYLIVLLAMAGIGVTVLSKADSTGKRKAENYRVRIAQTNVNHIAEALGRFKFHTGRYPDAEDGIDCLSNNDDRLADKYPGWNGRYLGKRNAGEMILPPDPWKRAYVYEVAPTGFPIVLSLGPDGKRGTVDDVMADPALFEKPFRDTTWTNDWVPYRKRGIYVAPAVRAGR